MQQNVGLPHLLRHVVIINRANYFYALIGLRIVLAEFGKLLSAYLSQSANNMQLKIKSAPQSCKHGQDCAKHVLMPQRTGS
jgi:hypothetical protein